MLGQQRRVGASADWGRLRYTMDEGSARAVRVAFERLYRDGLAYRTEALVNWCPGCRTSVSDLEVVAHARDRDALVGPLPPDRRGDRRARSRRDDHRRHDPPRDDPRRHGGRRPSRRRALRAPSSGGACASRSSSATCRSSPTRSSIRRSGPARVKITPAHDHDDYATGLRHGLPAITVLADDAHDRRHRHALRRPRPVRGPPPDRRGPRGAGRPRGRGAARDGHRPLPAQRRRHRAAAQDPVVHPDRAARRAGARGDPLRADPDPAGAVREDLGALADEHPRLERQSASCGGATGSRPGTARTAT